MPLHTPFPRPQGNGRVRYGTEVALNTPVAGGNDTVPNTTNRFYSFFTVPATFDFYLITGIEWKNGTAVGGNVMAHLETVDANPPVGNAVTLRVWTPVTAQSGTSAVQRVTNQLSGSLIVQGGTLLGGSLSFSSATARIGTTTVGSSNNLKAISLGAAPAIGNTTAWAAGTEEPYIKVYGKPLVIV